MINAQPTPLRDDDRTPSWGWLVEVATWLGAGVGAFLLLVLCSEWALAGAPSPATLDTRSRNHPDYSPWPSAVIHRVQVQIVDAFLQDLAASPESGDSPPSVALAPGDFWPAQVEAVDLTQIPSRTPSPVPEALESPTPPVIGPITASSTAAFTSSPSGSPTPARSATPTATRTPTAPARTAPSPTRTPTVGNTASTSIPPTMTNVPSPTSTAPPPSPTQTLVPTTIPSVGGEFFLCGETGLCPSRPGGAAKNGTPMTTYYFYSDPLPEGEIHQTSETEIHLYATNSSGMPMMIGVMLFVGDSSWSPLGGHSITVGANTADPVLVSGRFSINSHTVVPGERLRLQVMGGFGAVFYWDGQYADTRVIVP